MSSRKAIKYAVMIIWLVMLLVFAYITFKFGVVRNELDSIVFTYGYFGIFAIAFLADMLMQPVAPDLPLIGGILMGANVFLALLAASLGTYLASIVSYHLGRLYGEWGFQKFYTEKTYKKVKKVLNKYGRAGVAIAALTPVPYVPFCWLVGMFRMKQTEFIIFALGARTLRLIGVTFIVWLIVGF